MEYSFPFPVRVRSSAPSLAGLRLSPFTNIDGEVFGTPSLNGLWRIDMSVIARGMQAHLALSGFIDAMSQAGATCAVPVCTQWRPNDQYGRPLTGCDMAPEYLFDHVGFLGDPFDGFTLRRPAAHRDSYVDVDKPALSHLWIGHFFTLDDRLYRVINVSAIDESDTSVRLSVIPNIRGNHEAGKVVIVDQLRLRCQMEEGSLVGFSADRIKESRLSFVEAF